MSKRKLVSVPMSVETVASIESIVSYLDHERRDWFLNKNELSLHDHVYSDVIRLRALARKARDAHDRLDRVDRQLGMNSSDT